MNTTGAARGGGALLAHFSVEFLLRLTFLIIPYFFFVVSFLFFFVLFFIFIIIIIIIIIFSSRLLIFYYFFSSAVETKRKGFKEEKAVPEKDFCVDRKEAKQSHYF